MQKFKCLNCDHEQDELGTPRSEDASDSDGLCEECNFPHFEIIEVPE
jgi:hypothetical protein